MIVLSNIFVLNIAKNTSMEITFQDSVKIAWDSTFVDALGPRDAIEINPKSNTDYSIQHLVNYTIHTYYTIDNETLLNKSLRFIMIACTFK